MIVNKLYNQLKEDIAEIYRACFELKTDLSYIIEYRTYTYDSLYRICKMLLAGNINSIYISTGYKLDDIYDHLIAMTMIQKKIPDINIIPNGNIFNENHRSVIKAAELPRIRVGALHSANLFLK
jgi:deoxyribose-phosphate aldolase